MLASPQVNVPALYDELSVRTPAQMARVSRRACTICMLFYAVAGFAGCVGELAFVLRQVS
jgi:hypothetical protein